MVLFLISSCFVSFGFTLFLWNHYVLVLASVVAAVPIGTYSHAVVFVFVFVFVSGTTDKGPSSTRALSRVPNPLTKPWATSRQHWRPRSTPLGVPWTPLCRDLRRGMFRRDCSCSRNRSRNRNRNRDSSVRTSQFPAARRIATMLTTTTIPFVPLLCWVAVVFVFVLYLYCVCVCIVFVLCLCMYCICVLYLYCVLYLCIVFVFVLFRVRTVNFVLCASFVLFACLLG